VRVAFVVLTCALASAMLVPPVGAAQGQPGTVTRTTVVRWPAVGQEHSFLRRFRAPPGYLKRVRVTIYGVTIPTRRFVANVACIGAGDKRSPALAQQAWVWSGSSLHLLVQLRTNRCSSVALKYVRVKVVMTSVGT